jgi:hypothetical protein
MLASKVRLYHGFGAMLIVTCGVHFGTLCHAVLQYTVLPSVPGASSASSVEMKAAIFKTHPLFMLHAHSIRDRLAWWQWGGL